MAIKYFCDVCSNEIEGPMSEAAETEFIQLRSDQAVKLTVSAQMVNDKGSHISWDICKYCVIDAMNLLDDRPQPEATTNDH